MIGSTGRVFIALLLLAPQSVEPLQLRFAEHEKWIVHNLIEAPAEKVRGTAALGEEMLEEEVQQAKRLLNFRRFMMNCLLFPERLHVSNRISEDVPYANLEEQVLTFPERRPRTFNVVMATFKTWLADLIVQIGQKKTGQIPHFDIKRSVSFAAFGFAYVGMIQWFFYVTVFTALCPHAIEFSNAPWQVKLHDAAGRVDLVKQVCYDNFLLQAFIYFPVFYTLKEVIHNGGVGGDGLCRCTYTALCKYRENFKKDNITSCAIWLPLDFLVFAAPIYLRLPLDHLVSFSWTMLLSHNRGGSTEQSAGKAEASQGVETG